MCFKKHFSRVSYALQCSVARSPQHPSLPPHHTLRVLLHLPTPNRPPAATCSRSFLFISLLLYTPPYSPFPCPHHRFFFSSLLPSFWEWGYCEFSFFLFFFYSQKMIRLGFEHQTKRLKGFAFSPFGKSWCTDVYKAWIFDKQLNIRHPQRKSCPLALMSRAHFISEVAVLVWAQRIFWLHWNL